MSVSALFGGLAQLARSLTVLVSTCERAATVDEGCAASIETLLVPVTGWWQLKDFLFGGSTVWGMIRHLLGGGNSKIFYFIPKIGEMIQFDEYFSDGMVQPPTR